MEAVPQSNLQKEIPPHRGINKKGDTPKNTREELKMRKKMISLLLTAAMVLTMTGCGGGTTTEQPKEGAGTDTTQAPADNTQTSGGYELALITDVGTIDDKSFNQGSWEGLEAYAKEKNITHKYYKPTEKSDEACMTAIDLAVKGGAKAVVCPGFLFEVPIYNVQDKYPDVKFVLIDGEPKSPQNEVKINSNVLAISYAEEQAGFLAGYAAVKDGYKQLGFMGGIAVPAVIRYGYGFIQGADYAAKEMGLKKGDINIKYTYVGNFDASPENMSKAASWYNEGTEVIFACGGGVGNSVMKAAETAGKKVIGVDVDQASESETVITSSMKNLQKSVSDALESFYNGTFNGGVSVILDATTDSVELPMETSRFTTFTKEDYDAIYKKIVDGSVKIEKETIATDATGVPAEVAVVNLVK